MSNRIVTHVALALKCWATSRAPVREGLRMVGLALVAATYDPGTPVYRLQLGQLRGTFRRAVTTRRTKLDDINVPCAIMLLHEVDRSAA